MTQVNPASELRIAMSTNLAIGDVLSLALTTAEQISTTPSTVHVTDRSAQQLGLSLREPGGSASLSLQVAAITRDGVTRATCNLDPAASTPTAAGLDTYRKFLSSFAMGVHRADPAAELHVHSPDASPAADQGPAPAGSGHSGELDMIPPDRVVTAPTHPAVPNPRPLGLVYGRVVISRNFMSDFGSDLSSMTGGRLGGIERAIDSGLGQATRRIRARAAELGAHAVIGIDVSVQTVADKAQLVLLVGTAVVDDPGYQD